MELVIIARIDKQSSEPMNGNNARLMDEMSSKSVLVAR
jgi:hypothetical protein